ncbi:MAG: redoxin domain-containing protein [Bacteroidota bacterium]
MEKNQNSMRLLILVSVFSLISNLSLSQIAKEIPANTGVGKKGYEIRIKVDGVSDSLCYLANYFGDKQYLRDSVYADKNGNIVFKGDTALKGGIYLIVLPGKKYFEVIVDKEQHFSMSTVEGNYVSNMKITGSNDNVKFYDYLKFINARSQEINPLRQEYDNFKSTDPARAEKVKTRMTEIDSIVLKYRRDMVKSNPDFLLAAVLKATEEPEIPTFPPNADGTRDTASIYYYYKAHFFDNFNLQDDRLLYTPVFHPRLENFFTKMLLQIPDSINREADWLIAKLKPGSEIFKYVVWWVTNHYETSKIMGMDAVFVHMAENHYTKEKAFWVDETQLFKIQDRARILKPILIGKKVKNLVMTDDKGVPRSLYDVKAKYTVLYFWDPDCGHCKKVTPKLKDYFDQVKKQGIAVYAVCTEVEMDKWKKFIAEYKLDWINVADPELKNNFRFEFDITSTPQIFLLDENKQIFAKRIEVAALSEILQKEFKKLGIDLPVMPHDPNETSKVDGSGH